MSFYEVKSVAPQRLSNDQNDPLYNYFYADGKRINIPFKEFTVNGAKFAVFLEDVNSPMPCILNLWNYTVILIGKIQSQATIRLLAINVIAFNALEANDHVRIKASGKINEILPFERETWFRSNNRQVVESCLSKDKVALEEDYRDTIMDELREEDTFFDGLSEIVAAISGISDPHDIVTFEHFNIPHAQYFNINEFQ